MIPHLVYSQLVILGLVWLCVMLPSLWPTPPVGCPRRQLSPARRVLKLVSGCEFCRCS